MSTPGELLEALGREARARFAGGGETTTRVYRGRSVDELVPQIQRDLGADAIIVRRREGLTGGVLGFFQRTYVEIEAMPGTVGVDVYDEDTSVQPESPQSAAPALSAPAPAPAAARPLAAEYRPVSPRPFVPDPALPVAPPPAAEQRPLSGYASPQPGGPAPPPSSASTSAAPPPPFYTREPAPPTRAGSAYVTAHLAALARADRAKPPPQPPRPPAPLPVDPAPWRAEPAPWDLDATQQPDARRESRAAQAPTPLGPPPERTAAPRPSWPASERREVAPGSQGRARAGVARSLQRCGIGEALANELIDGASAHALALAPRAGLAQAVRATLAQRIPVAPPLPSKGAVIVIVGAGGAGKTTCCATLLGAYRRSSSLPAGFATITREPERGELQMIISPYVMKPVAARAPRALRALRRVRGDGIAVLDTPSVSPSDRTGVRELARLLAELKPERVVVALPATLGATAAAQLLQALKPLGANALAITHGDETDQIGVAVEAACRFELAPEYMLERARAGGWRLRQLAPGALADRLLP
jgi:flagellar biosynthesis GTPase FlhF